MGVWGHGNFDNDYALNVLDDFVAKATKGLHNWVKAKDGEVEDIDDIAAYIEIHIALIRHCHARAPEVEFITQLRQKMLSTYDAQIDALDPTGEYKVKRRAVLVNLLDRYRRAGRPT